MTMSDLGRALLCVLVGVFLSLSLVWFLAGLP